MTQKTMFITGGGRGIGAATARLAARAGYDVAIGYRARIEEARATAESVRECGRRALLLGGEISDETTVVGWFERIGAEWGRLDCLVNNAGVVAPQARLESFTAARVARVLEVNVLGALLCARQAVRHMSTARGGAGGSVVNVSSMASLLGSPGEYIDYAASKGALDTLTIGLAKEVAREGIRVNGVRPGLIETELHADSGEPDRVARLASTIPLGRGGKAEEVAKTILWLASDEASYVTGTLLNCSGGR